MDYLLLAGSVACSSTSSIFGGYFNRACVGKKDSSSYYNLFQLLTVFLGWTLLFALNADFNIAVLPYAIGFGIAYCVSTFGIINALRTGPVLLTSLIQQFSLIAVTVWGFFFWDATPTTTVVIGLVLVMIAIFLCLYTGKRDDSKAEEKISLRWLLYVAMAFVGNAACTIVQRTQQMAFDGQYGNMLMMIATFFGLIFYVVKFFMSDRSDAKFITKKCYLPIATGACNLLLNLFVMILATSSLSSSLIYPTISIGALIIVTLFSLFAFRERLRVSQWVGVALGIVSVLLLSI